MIAEPGLRERKKQQTREAIAEAGRRLFAERGFNAVTVAEVARAANVSEVTVFNYFPTKEDLFYGGMRFFEEKLLDAVRERASGESVLDAFRRPVLDGLKRLAGDEAAQVIATAGNLISASPALEATSARSQPVTRACSRTNSPRRPAPGLATSRRSRSPARSWECSGRWSVTCGAAFSRAGAARSS